MRVQAGGEPLASLLVARGSLTLTPAVPTLRSETSTGDQVTSEMGVFRTIKPAESMVLAVDLQTKLLPLIADHEFVISAAGTLIEAAAVFDLPVLATVQYVKGLGATHPQLADILRRRAIEPLEKAAFSVCGDAACSGRLQEIGRRQVVVTGIEGHVCVQQTVLDLLEIGLQPIVCADAVGSRHDLDLDLALIRMQQAGAAITTTEAVLFEWCRVSGTAQFKKVLELVKALDRHRE